MQTADHPHTVGHNSIKS